MSEPEAKTPLWAWVLLGVAPGLFCDALILMLLVSNGSMDSGMGVLYVLLAMPLVGTVYLIVLGFRYVDAGMGTSVVRFVVQFFVLNVVLVGAGCSLILLGN